MSGGNRGDRCGRTEGLADMTKPIDAFLEFANGRRRQVLLTIHQLTACKSNVKITNLDILLNVQLSITLVNDKLDAQFFYFITCLLQSSTCCEQRRAHHQEVRLY